VRISHLVRSDSTLCEVTVGLANNVQIMAQDRDLDAIKAIFKALERARVQVSQSLRQVRRRQMMEALTGSCPLLDPSSREADSGLPGWLLRRHLRR